MTKKVCIAVSRYTKVTKVNLFSSISGDLTNSALHEWIERNVEITKFTTCVRNGLNGEILYFPGSYFAKLRNLVFRPFRICKMTKFGILRIVLRRDELEQSNQSKTCNMYCIMYTLTAITLHTFFTLHRNQFIYTVHVICMLDIHCCV